MKYLFYFYFLILIGLGACQKKEALNPENCDKNLFMYLYFNNEEKYKFPPVNNQIWIEFKINFLKKSEITEILNKYDFLDLPSINSFSENFSSLRVNLNRIPDCQTLDNFLIQLNADSEIKFASPILGNSKNLNEYLIIVSEVIARPKEGISRADYEKFANEIGLRIKKEEYNSYLLEIIDPVNGYEPILMANKLYENRELTIWAEPNFIAPLSFP